MCKSISHDLVSKVHKQMRRLQGHFLIAALSPLDEAEAAAAAAWEATSASQPTVSHEVVNTRQAVLHFCQAHGLQFSSLRYAQYSTMKLLYEIAHPTQPASTPTYCLPTCPRGRLDDGSLMLGCDFCDSWFHPACLQAHMPERLPEGDETFICPMCFDAQAEIADDYISDQFLVDNFGGAGGSGSADYASIEGFASLADLGSIDAAI